MSKKALRTTIGLIAIAIVFTAAYRLIPRTSESPRTSGPTKKETVHEEAKAPSPAKGPPPDPLGPSAPVKPIRHAVVARVFNPDGSPISFGNAVFFGSKEKPTTQELKSGKAELELPPGPARVVILPMSPTLAIGYVDTSETKSPSELSAVLQEGTSVRGVVLDMLGRPVANASVTVKMTFPAAAGVVTEEQAYMQGYESRAFGSRPTLTVSSSEVSILVSTSDSGEFQVDQLPRGAVKVIASQAIGGHTEMQVTVPSPNETIEIRLPKATR